MLCSPFKVSGLYYNIEDMKTG